MNSTSDLFRRIQKSDEKAYEEMFTIYFSKIVYFLTSIVKDREVSSDLAQDLFLKLWENRATLSISGDADTYIYVMAKNRAIDYLRRRKLEEKLADSSIHMGDSYFNPESSYCAKDSLEHIDRIIEQMPKQRREIFRMSRVHGLSYKEIAEALNLAVKTVESHIYSALKQINRKINN